MEGTTETMGTVSAQCGPERSPPIARGLFALAPPNTNRRGLAATMWVLVLPRSHDSGHSDLQAIRDSRHRWLRASGSCRDRHDRHLDRMVRCARPDNRIPTCQGRSPGMPSDRVPRGMRRVHAGFLSVVLSCVREQPRLFALVRLHDGLREHYLRRGMLREPSRGPSGPRRVLGTRGLPGSAMLDGLPLNSRLPQTQGRMSTGVPPLLT